jgi:hypothetical protein
MTSASQAPPRRPRRVRRSLLHGFVGVAGLSAVFFLHGLWDYVEARRLNAYITAQEGHGAALRGVESAPGTGDSSLTAAPDARAYYVAAGALVEGDPAPLVRVLRAGNATPDDLERAHALLDRNGTPLELAGTAVRLPLRPVWAYDRAVRDQAFSLVPLQRLLSLRALVLARGQTGQTSLQGLTDEAHFARLFDLAHYAYMGPDGAYGAASREIALDSSAVVSEPGMGDPELRRLQELLSSLDRPMLAERFCVAVRASTLGRLWPRQDIDAFSTPEWPPAITLDLSGYLARPVRRRHLLNWMKFLSAFVEAARLPLPQMLPAMRAIRAGDYGVVPAGRGRNTLDPALVGRMLTGAALDTLLTATLNRAATTAVIIERYRRAHDGALPSALDALVPAFANRLPADPVNGDPLKLVESAEGYVVYGAGANQRDDGGHIDAPNAAADRVGRDADDWGVRIRFRSSQ